ncbi:spore coat protein [Exiguobacterium sp. KRL4]|uniref:spore coat protein n=1 Tax=Exiguobacterium sp. KRL4 TaxID=1914536 RepID=UPI0008F829B5|nr:spore coat protein [Exiguobacterium sp. KRL4]OIN65481.1 spore coat protein [Exiguobacterium sp. KRL4]
MAKKELAIHETLEIHEILTVKQACLVKAYALSPLVKDENLKKLIEQDVKDCEQAIEELQKLLK